MVEATPKFADRLIFLSETLNVVFIRIRAKALPSARHRWGWMNLDPNLVYLPSRFLPTRNPISSTPWHASFSFSSFLRHSNLPVEMEEVWANRGWFPLVLASKPTYPPLVDNLSPANLVLPAQSTENGISNLLRDPSGFLRIEDRNDEL